MELLPGFGFRPYDEELVGYYLYHKLLGNTLLVDEAITEVFNIYSFDPWTLRFRSKFKSRDHVWYFFYRIENNYANGTRQSRTTPSGFWKLTGDSMEVKDQCGIWGERPGQNIGSKRVLVFRKGKNSDKTKSDWVIHELHCSLLPQEAQRNYVICRLEYKGDDLRILSDNATDPNPTFVPNMTNMVDQSFQVNSESYNTNSQYYSANPAGYSNYSAPDEESPEMLWDYVVPKYNERRSMQEHYSHHQPKKPVTGAFSDDSSDSDTDSMNCRDTSSSTDSVGSSNGPKQLLLQLQGQQKVKDMQKSESMWKMAEDTVKKGPSTKAVKQNWVVFETMSLRRKSQWNYLKNVIIGFLLFISIMSWIILSS